MILSTVYTFRYYLQGYFYWKWHFIQYIDRILFEAERTHRKATSTNIEKFTTEMCFCSADEKIQGHIRRHATLWKIAKAEIRTWNGGTIRRHSTNRIMYYYNKSERAYYLGWAGLFWAGLTGVDINIGRRELPTQPTNVTSPTIYKNIVSKFWKINHFHHAVPCWPNNIEGCINSTLCLGSFKFAISYTYTILNK